MEGVYEVAAEYKGFRSDARRVTVIGSGVIEEFKLPPYTEVFSVTLTYWTLLAIVIGALLGTLVIAVVMWHVTSWLRERRRVRGDRWASPIQACSFGTSN